MTDELRSVTTDRADARAATGTRGQLARFLVIGVLTVVVDFTTYRLLLAAGVPVGWAKAIGFVTGTVFAYFANRRWTFEGARPRSGSALRFALLYACTLAINVGINAWILRLALAAVPPTVAVSIAFVAATGVSAVLNFVGMKFFVFEPRIRSTSLRPDMPELSLVIPCYNEAKNLPLLVERCTRLVDGRDIEVILVDNGSTDDSPAVLQALLTGRQRLRQVRVPVNLGYGHGIVEGLKAATGEVIGWTHADLQTDPMDTVQALALFEAGGSGQFVKGRRYGRPLGDQAFTLAMSGFETVLLQKPLYDINAQPTLFPRSFFATWEAPPSDFSLDLYAYYMARRAGLPIRRFPALFGKRAHGVSHWNVNWAAKRKFIRRTIDYSLVLRRTLNRLSH